MKNEKATKREITKYRLDLKDHRKALFKHVCFGNITNNNIKDMRNVLVELIFLLENVKRRNAEGEYVFKQIYKKVNNTEIIPVYARKVSKGRQHVSRQLSANHFTIAEDQLC